ncbi:PH domain-containing protein [Microbacterium sp.]|uniref:PH domain-containing protein n=1 Tax=Microbacterium sp. TaxID=51671 RepID=UPI002FE05135
MTQPDRPEGARTFRASSGPVVMALTSALALYLLGDTAVRGSLMQMLLVAPWLLLGLWIVYQVSFVSRVRVDAHGALVQNMLRRTTFGWSRVRDIDFRWQLEFALDDGKTVACYGGPARSRPTRSRMRSNDEAPKAPVGVRDLSDIRELWQAGSAGQAPIVRSWDGPALIALAVIVLWAVGAVLITQAG